VCEGGAGGGVCGSVGVERLGVSPQTVWGCEGRRESGGGRGTGGGEQGWEGVRGAGSGVVHADLSEDNILVHKVWGVQGFWGVGWGCCHLLAIIWLFFPCHHAHITIINTLTLSHAHVIPLCCLCRSQGQLVGHLCKPGSWGVGGAGVGGLGGDERKTTPNTPPLTSIDAHPLIYSHTQIGTHFGCQHTHTPTTLPCICAISQGQLVVIDVSQAVDLDHPKALEHLHTQSLSQTLT
jgi:hypothetical protein